MLDGAELKLKSSKDKTLFNSIYRYEFIELLIKIVEIVYLKNVEIRKFGMCLNMFYEERLMKLLVEESDRRWGGIDWRHAHLLRPNVTSIYLVNFKLMESLQKKFTTRGNRTFPAAKSIDFLLEDAIAMFEPFCFSREDLEAAFSQSR